MSMLSLVLLLCAGSTFLLSEAGLTTSGSNLFNNGQKVFLSGVNIAWNSYGYDFGNGAYEANSKATLERWLTQIANAGGNSVRLWLHVEGDNTPAYDASGYVTGPDRTGTMISDMRSFLDFAQSKNIVVIFCLWNGAVLRNQNTINLFYDEGKLFTYVENALKPMVAALGNHPALGAWEIMNEPEGSVYNNQASLNPCFDTTLLIYSGAGWAGTFIPMENILKFVNWQAQGIKEANPTNLVTVGSWNAKAQSDAFSDTRNYYTDTCLIAAGGKPLGVLDFYQIHSYSNGGVWDYNGPFKVNAAAYGLSKPVVIGEYASICAAGESIQQLYQYAYDQGYAGAWDWQYNAGGGCADSQATQDAGMNQLRGQNGAGGLVNFPVGK